MSKLGILDSSLYHFKLSKGDTMMRKRTLLWIVVMVLGLLVLPVGGRQPVYAAPPVPWADLMDPNSVTADPCPTPDPYEGATRDDYFENASTLTTAGQPGHTFDQWMDKDWMKFEAEAGVIYVIQTTNLHPVSDPSGYFADTVMTLFEDDGVTQLAENDDYDGSTNASQIRWQAPADGTYYIKIRNYNPGFFGCDVGYDVLFSEFKPLDIEKVGPGLELPFTAGQRITYTITVANNSSAIHTNVVVTDMVPVGLQYVGIVQSGILPMLRFNLGTLAPGAVEELELVFEVLSGYPEVGGNVAGVQSEIDGNVLPVQTVGPVFPYPDADGDGIPNSVECPGGTDCPDSDNDNTPDYMDNDSDGDGVPDSEEWGSANCPMDPDRPDCDTDGDGLPNYLDNDDDGDGILTENEDLDGDGDPTNDDTDGDGLPNYLDNDDDGDGISSKSECPNGSTCPDTDGDKVPDYLDDDDDGDGIPTATECPGGSTCPDVDSDGTPDYLDDDSDGDGRSDMQEAGCEDLSMDGQAEPDTCPDSLPDSDKDGVPDYLEPYNEDTDGDGKFDQYDDDDDGDGIPTSEECPNGPVCPDSDGDGDPDFLDNDSDNDGISDEDEYDGNGDGIPDDIDGDGIPDYVESNTGDTDGDGTPDYMDDDDDGDGIPTAEECPGGLACIDTDGDGVPDYLDDDDDGDGIATEDEDLDGNGDPTNDDSDGDGIPDYLESNTGDTDGDGTPDYMDDDDDGDGIPTATECPGGPVCPDTDGDGIPDYLDPDNDGDGIPDSEECPGGTDCLDTDGDGVPDYLETNIGDTDGDGHANYDDPDDDGDSLPTASEDPDEDGDPTNDDSDGDGTSNYLDNDDDNDGILTEDEYNNPADANDDFCANGDLDSDRDGIPNCQDNDVDGDGTPNYLDLDSDDDGILDKDEYDANHDSTPDDTDGDGVPDWLDPVYFVYIPVFRKR